MEGLYIFIIVIISLGISMCLTGDDMEKDDLYSLRLNTFQLSVIFIFRWVVFSAYLVFIYILIQSI